MKEKVFLFVEKIITRAYSFLFCSQSTSWIIYSLNRLFLSPFFWFWHMSAHANAILMDRAVVKVVAHMHTNSSLWPSLSDLFHLNIVLFALQFVWVFFFAVCHPRSLSEMSVNNEFFCHLFIALGIIFLKDSRTPLESHRLMLHGSNGEMNPRLIPWVQKLLRNIFSASSNRYLLGKLTAQYFESQIQTLLDLLKQCCASLLWSAFLSGSVTAMRLTPVTHRSSIFIPWKAFGTANSDIRVNWICSFNRVSTFFWVICR